MRNPCVRCYLLCLWGQSCEACREFQPPTLSHAPRPRLRCRTPYLASVSVLFTEAAKLVICLAVQMRNSWRLAREGDAPAARELRKQMENILLQAAPMLLPAGMFVMQQVGHCPWRPAAVLQG